VHDILLFFAYFGIKCW